MGVILDTSVLIAAEKQRLSLEGLFSAHPHETFSLAAISAAELLHGVERASPPARRQARSRYVEWVLAELEVIDYDLALARTHARLWADLRKTGSGIGAYDLLIAATALHYDLALATLNTGEFARVSGLRRLELRPYQTPARES